MYNSQNKLGFCHSFSNTKLVPYFYYFHNLHQYYDIVISSTTIELTKEASKQAIFCKGRKEARRERERYCHILNNNRAN
jgi:hypothetical protein